MPTIQSWAVSDGLWSRVEPLLPQCDPRTGRPRRFRRRPGGGRKPISPRQIFAAIVHALRTGCQWKALPKSFGSASAIHHHFQKWRREGFFVRLWRAGLAEYDEMEGIAWEWQSLDGTQGKAPLAQEAVGNNPADRGKKRDQAQSAGGRSWRPALAYRRRGQPARRQTPGPDAGRGRDSPAQAGEEKAAESLRGQR
jgi:transposase